MPQYHQNDRLLLYATVVWNLFNWRLGLCQSWKSSLLSVIPHCLVPRGLCIINIQLAYQLLTSKQGLLVPWIVGQLNILFFARHFHVEVELEVLLFAFIAYRQPRVAPVWYQFYISGLTDVETRRVGCCLIIYIQLFEDPTYHI